MTHGRSASVKSGGPSIDAPKRLTLGRTRLALIPVRLTLKERQQSPLDFTQIIQLTLPDHEHFPAESSEFPSDSLITLPVAFKFFSPE
jgi:hypothetical protein